MKSIQSYLMDKNYGIFKKALDVVIENQDNFCLPRIVIVGSGIRNNGHLYLVENLLQQRIFNRDNHGGIIAIHNSIKIRFKSSVEEKVVVECNGNIAVRSTNYSANLLCHLDDVVFTTDTDILITFSGSDYPSKLEIIALPSINTKYLTDDHSILIPVIDAPKGDLELDYIYNLPLLKIIHVYKKQNNTIIALRGVDKVDATFFQDCVMDILIPEVIKSGNM